MEASTRWPANVCTGGDFVFGTWEIRDGQQVIDLNVSLDDLPIQSGWQLAIHEETVRQMLRCLRWATPEQVAELETRLIVAEADAGLLRQALAEQIERADQAETALTTVTKVRTSRAQEVKA